MKNRTFRGNTPVTEHYRNGKCIGITEHKRIHNESHIPSTMDGKKRKLTSMCSLIQKGRHDMACYIYHIT